MRASDPNRAASRESHWLWVLCLVGLDYFSSLAYQPSISFEASGIYAPLATLVVVVFTLFGALPVYCYVAGRSPNGQGAIGLLERSVHGWLGKLLILVLLGFAAADFVITRTLSVADSAIHVIHNPYPPWQRALGVLANAGESVRQFFPTSVGDKLIPYWNARLSVAILLSILGFTFWTFLRRGHTRRVVQIAVVVVTAYLILNAIVVVSALGYLRSHYDLLNQWWNAVLAGTRNAGLGQSYWAAGWTIAAASLLAFPRMSLGLSGFELSMVVMPLIRGGQSKASTDPGQRVRNARKLLILSAMIMAVYLLGSSLAAATLIPPAALLSGGEASNRALAYLAHGGPLVTGQSAAELNPLFGELFGTVYDVSTILILSLAGASVTLGLRDLVPQYMHRLGMELEWSHHAGAILHVFNFINLIVTVGFRASVDAQRGAYATSVLVLISTAAVAVALDRWGRQLETSRRHIPWYYLCVSLAFMASAAAAAIANPVGVVIALGFVLVILLWSIVSRALRSMELRCEAFEFADAESKFLWESLQYLEFPVLVPHRPGRHTLDLKEDQIRQRHRLTREVPVVFVEVELGDASDFLQKPLIRIIQEEGRFIIRITNCASISHVLAAAALELSKVGQPPEIHFGWSDESPVSANLNFLLFGRGNIPWMVRELIRKAEPNPERQPRVIIG
jgi:hypothetical protein